MPGRNAARGLLRRHALALWFCAIAAMGAIEFHRNAFAAGAFAPSPAAWLWLAGTGACALVGLALLWRGLRGKP